jgi:hypothetical protein
MRYNLLKIPVMVLVMSLVTACIPAGHIEWTQTWGGTPLQQAAATCRYQANAVTPALCYGIVGCAAESNRTENLFYQCMQAAGWQGRFVQNATVAPPSPNGSGEVSLCQLIDGSTIMASDWQCRFKGGTMK